VLREKGRRKQIETPKFDIGKSIWLRKGEAYLVFVYNFEYRVVRNIQVTHYARTFHFLVSLPVYPNRVCIKVLSIVKNHPFSQLELDRSVVYPSPIFSKTGDEVVILVFAY